jgi:hypothetical protein
MTTTDMVLPSEPAQLVALPEPSALALWADDARIAAQLAGSLCKTNFVPMSLRGKPEDATAAILAGQELGLPVMASLRSMDVIQGTPALRAHAMRGLVQSHGHSVQLVSSDDTRCVMRGRRAGEAEWQEVEWTIDRASKLGLTTKPEWKKQPQTMLLNRATGEVCRLIAADCLFAMPYAAEELDNGPAHTNGPVPGRVTAAEILGRPEPDDEPAPPLQLDEVDEPWPAVPEPGGEQ